MNLAGFFWLTQRAIDYANSSTPSVLPSLTKGEHHAQTGVEGSAHGVEHIRQTEVHAQRWAFARWRR